METKDKKKKKKKNEKVSHLRSEAQDARNRIDHQQISDSAPASNPGFSNAFDTVDLGDPPSLDLTFGNEASAADTNSSFQFSGGWSSSWDTPGKLDHSDMNYANIGTANTTNEDQGASVGGSFAWPTSGSVKSKKKPATSSFGIGDLATLGEEPEQPKIEKAPVDHDETWNGDFTTTAKKTKKSKKKEEIEEVMIEEPMTLDGGDKSVDHAAGAAEGYNSWEATSGKKNGKKTQQTDLEASITNFPSPPSLPIVPVTTGGEIDWSSGNKREKKKGRKAVAIESDKKAEPEILVVPEPPSEIHPPPPPPPPVASVELGGKNLWSSGAKKGAKKGKKFETVEPENTAEPAIVVVPEPSLEVKAASEAVFGFGLDSKSNKKKSEKGHSGVPTWMETSDALDSSKLQEDPAGDIGWAFEDKEGEYGNQDAWNGPNNDVSVMSPAADIGSIDDTGWGSFGAKKSKNRGKNAAVEETKAVNEPDIVDVLATTKAAEEDFSWGAKPKKTKKGPKVTLLKRSNRSKNKMSSLSRRSRRPKIQTLSIFWEPQKQPKKTFRCGTLSQRRLRRKEKPKLLKRSNRSKVQSSQTPRK